MKRVRIVSCLLVVVLFVGFQVGFAATAPPDLPKKVVIASFGAGTTSHATSSVMSKLITNHTPMPCATVPFTDPQASIEGLRAGAADMILTTSQTAWISYNGLFGAPKAPFLRLIQGGNLMSVGFIVRNNSGLFKGTDLKGKRVARPESPSMRNFADAEMANIGLTWDEVTVIPITGRAETAKVIKESLADVAQISVGSPDMRELDAVITGGVRFLGLDNSPKAVMRMKEIFPGYSLRLFKAKSQPGILADIYLMSFQMYLFSRHDFSDQAAYLITKALYEHHGILAPAHPLLKEWTPEKFVVPESTVIPYHSGAIKFYKEAGLWTAEAQKIHDKLIK